MIENARLFLKDGARGRSDATEWNQSHSIVQPSGLTNGVLPSPAQPLSNRRHDPASTLPRKRTLSDPSVCTLYFIAGAGLIKIGITTNLTSRFRAIKNASPVPVVILATMPGCTFYEGKMHERFSHLRQHGEWFTDDGEIREHIETLAKVGKAELRTFGPCLATTAAGGGA